MLKFSDLALTDKRVMIRLDLNVPLKNGEVASDTRIRATLPTIRMGLEKGAAIILLSHLGRPVEGEFDAQFSLAPVARHLSALLAQEVRLVSDWLSGIDVAPGEIVLCENVRFNVGEKANADELARTMAGLCDVFVMDAFGTAHRAQASTHGVVKYAPVACAGPLLVGELDALSRAISDPVRPVVAIVGGSKVSTKLTVLKSLMEKVDQLIVGGGIANTFIAASGYAVGESLYEPDLVDEARRLMSAASGSGEIPLPEDVVVSSEVSESAPSQVRSVDAVEADEMILDIGPRTAARYAAIVKVCRHDCLERSGRCIRNRSVRCRYGDPRQGSRRQPSLQYRGRWRHPRGPGEIRGDGSYLLYIHGRRRISRVPRRQDLTRGRCTDAAGCRT